MVIMAKVIETNDSSESYADSEEEIAPSDDDKSKSNAGWADSVARILKTNKPKRKKCLVLSRAKKLVDVKKPKTKPAGFQVATTDGEIKEEKVELEEEETEQQPAIKRKRDLLSVRVKPNILEKDRERKLAKIATKGVVQLFNVVKMQQKEISKKLLEAGPLEVRKEKVLKSVDKRAFLDVLMGEKSVNVDTVDSAKETAKKEQASWSVLSDDFMMGAKLKDWDKELEKNVESEQNLEMESE